MCFITNERLLNAIQFFEKHGEGMHTNINIKVIKFDGLSHSLSGKLEAQLSDY